MNDTDFEIHRNQFISHIIDSVIEEIRKNPNQWASTNARKVATNLI